MGTRDADQPTEQWAGPESLDPTPVWKQYALVGILLIVGLVAVIAVAVAALAPQLVTPPALVPGDRLVLAATDVPGVGVAPRLVGRGVAGEHASFYLSQPAKGDVRALRTHWSPRPGGAGCDIQVEPSQNLQQLYPVAATGPVMIATCGAVALAVFDLAGTPLRGADRGLDRYLVSVSGDRVIVNLSRVIEASERTTAPVPTGIPQPQQTP